MCIRAPNVDQESLDAACVEDSSSCVEFVDIQRPTRPRLHSIVRFIFLFYYDINTLVYIHEIRNTGNG